MGFSENGETPTFLEMRPYLWRSNLYEVLNIWRWKFNTEPIKYFSIGIQIFSLITWKLHGFLINMKILENRHFWRDSRQNSILQIWLFAHQKPFFSMKLAKRSTYSKNIDSQLSKELSLSFLAIEKPYFSDVVIFRKRWRFFPVELAKIVKNWRFFG